MVAFAGIGVVDRRDAGEGVDAPVERGGDAAADETNESRRLVGTWSVEPPEASHFTVSSALCWILGVDPESWDGRGESLGEWIHPEDRRAVTDLHTRCLTLGLPYSTVFRVVPPGQPERWVFAEAKVLRDPSGAVRAAHGTVAELREDKAEDFVASRQPLAKRLEPQLGREHLTIVQRMSNSGSAEIDLVTRAAVWTEELYRLTGLDPAPGSPTFEEFLAHVHADDRQRVRRLILLTVRGEEIEPFEFRFLRPDGVQRWLRRHSEVRRDSTGRPQRLAEVYQDVTERKLLESELVERDAALRRGKEHLDVAQRIARVGSIDRDLVTRQATWSDEMFRLLGYRPGEVAVTHGNYIARVHPDDVPLVARLQQAAWAGEALEPVEYRLLMPSGEIRWVLREAAITLDASGKPAHSVSTLMDITDRKRLELELRRREDHLNLAQRIARVGSIERDLRTGEVIVSDEVYHLLGLEPGSLEATVESMAARTHPDDVALIRELHRSSWAGEPSPPVEYRVIRPDGAIVWVHRQAIITHDEVGRPIQSVSTLIDITERKRMEAELIASAGRLRRSEEHLNRAQRVAHVGSIERDLRTGIQYWSDEQYRLFGYEPGEVEASMANGMARVHPEDYARVEASASGIGRGEEPEALEYRLKWPDGTVRWVSREVAYTRDERGEAVTATITFVDITDRKKMETALIESAERLRRSEEHLNRAQRTAHVGSVAVDLRTGAAYWSDEQYRLFGYEAGEVEPTVANRMARVHPEDRATVVASIDAVNRGEEVAPLEYRLQWPDGTVRWVSREVAYTRDGNGKAIVATLTSIDITERKKMEHAANAAAEELRRSQEHLERAQRVGLIGSAQIDIHNNVSEWSDQYYRLLGLDPALGNDGQKMFRSAIHPEDLGKLQSYGELLAHKGPIPAIELRVPTADGGIRWLQRHAEVMRDSEGNPNYLVFTLQDITERKHLEAALVAYANELRSSREHLTRAQQAGQVGSLEYNVKTAAMYWSDETYRLLGVERHVVPSRARFIATVHPDDRKMFDQAVEQAEAGLPVEPITFRVVRPNGEIRWIYRVAELVRDSLDVSATVIATLTDVTELRQAQQEQARLQEHLAHAQRLESLGALSGGIAHDFNNLLTTILGNAALLRDDESLSPDAQHLAQAVIRATQQGAELTRRLLSFGRRQILNPVAIDLRTVARDLDALLRRTLGEEIELAIKPEPDLWRVTADKSQLEAAIINLAVNARDAMPEGGLLTIEMANRVFDDAYVAEHAGAVRGEYVAISVSDTGSGMAPDILEHAFEPFFTTKQEGRGTGLGLSMVYGFAKQSGGYSTIYSELGVGTRVTIFLPRSTERAGAAEAGPERRPKAAGGTERILLVEDDAMVREYLVTALERLGYQVTAMPDAHAALAYLDDGAAKIELLLTDLMLPGGMNGNHLAAEAARKRPGLRVLFASGYTQDALIRQGRLEPGQRLIAKPFASGELAAKVREALDS